MLSGVLPIGVIYKFEIFYKSAEPTIGVSYSQCLLHTLRKLRAGFVCSAFRRFGGFRISDFSILVFENVANQFCHAIGFYISTTLIAEFSPKRFSVRKCRFYRLFKLFNLLMKIPVYNFLVVGVQSLKELLRLYSHSLALYADP